MKGEHRGISLGTILMLGITVVVLLGCAMILPGLMGKPNGQVDVREVLSIFQMDSLPSLAMSEIPISDPRPSEETPTATPLLEALAPLATVEPTQAPTPTPTPKVGGTFTLTIGGTINMDDAVRKSAYYSESQKYDMTELLSLIGGEMSGDMTMVMLENLIMPDSRVSSLNAPEALAEMLSQSGVKLVTCGFSKVLDKGTDGLHTTLEALRDQNLKIIGAYETKQEAEPLILTLNSVPVAFLHYTDALSATGKKTLKTASAEYTVPLADAETIAADVRKARENGAAVVIVSLNWGSSGASKPTSAQKKLAQAIADAGVDVIVGAGTRVAQPVTWLTHQHEDGTIGQTLCAWSLGSLLNESRKDGNVAAMLLQLQIAWDGTNVSFCQVAYTPTYIWRQKWDGQYQYRVVASDQAAPSGMSEDQQTYMRKAWQRIETLLEDSPVTLRAK